MSSAFCLIIMLTTPPMAAQQAHPADAPAVALKIGRFLKNAFATY
jgi:hypothetical protein